MQRHIQKRTRALYPLRPLLPPPSLLILLLRLRLILHIQRVRQSAFVEHRTFGLFGEILVEVVAVLVVAAFSRPGGEMVSVGIRPRGGKEGLPEMIGAGDDTIGGRDDLNEITSCDFDGWDFVRRQTNKVCQLYQSESPR